MANSTLTLYVNDPIDPSLLNVKGNYSWFEHYFITFLICAFLLVCIWLASYVVYSMIKMKESHELAAFAYFLMGFLFIICSFCFIKVAARWNKKNYMEITEKGIIYAETDVFGGWLEHKVYWQDLYMC